MKSFPWAQRAVPRRVVRLPLGQPFFTVSDLHLGDGTRSDAFMGKDRVFLAFLEYVREHQAHLIINGDIIDFPQALTFTRVLRAHGPIFRELSRLADEVGVTYVWGNHDLDISFYRDLLRWEVCSAVEVGDEVLIQHGYQYDPYVGNSLRESSAATTVHHMVERITGSWIRTPLEEFYTGANRFTFWAAGRANQILAAVRRWAARAGVSLPPTFVERTGEYWMRCQLGDGMNMFRTVRDRMQLGDVRLLICGHSHVPGVVELAPGSVYANDGCWTFRDAGYGFWDGREFRVSDWISGQRHRDERYRLLMGGALEWVGLADWFDDEYLGWLRFRCGELRRHGLPQPSWSRPPVLEDGS